MKLRFRAILNVRGKEQAFSKTADTIKEIFKILNEEELMGFLVRVEPFKVAIEKQRGRTPRKY